MHSSSVLNLLTTFIRCMVKPHYEESTKFMLLCQGNNHPLSRLFLEVWQLKKLAGDFSHVWQTQELAEIWAYSDRIEVSGWVRQRGYELNSYHMLADKLL